MFEHYHRVPLDLKENLLYRVELRKAAVQSAWNRSCLMKACKDDPLFFFLAFCWLFEPRPRLLDSGERAPMYFPFLVWPHQADAVKEMYIDRNTGKPALGFQDVVVEKSRGEGMSWMGILFAMHSWLFEPYSKVGLVSRTEDMADDPENSDSLFWKIDWEMGMLPLWMTGKRDRDWKRVIARHTLTNKRNESVIAAAAATGDVFRGGRATWLLMDEFAFFKKGEDVDALNSSHGVTNSRLFVSTVNGQHNEYHRIANDPSGYKVVIDWKQNVSRNRGLYTFVDGLPKAVDPERNPLDAEYDPPTDKIIDLFSSLRRKGYNLESGERSPWYDQECDRVGMTPKRIAQELDRDYSGSESVVFGYDFKVAAKRNVARPTHTGRFTKIENTTSGELQLEAKWDSVRGGDTDLWVPLDTYGRPPRGSYVIGADVATGLGGTHTSNSTLVAFNSDTREQVLGFASSVIEPSDFADLATGIAWWFHGAYLAWEQNGPGAAFTKRMIRIGYGNVFRRKSLDRRGRSAQKQLGWWTDDKSKPVMFDEISLAIREGRVILKCEKLVQECGQYLYDAQGRIVHGAVGSSDDNASGGKAHGDRVIAAGVAMQALLDRPSSIITAVDREPMAEPPMDTMAYRMANNMYEDYEEQRDGDCWQGSVLGEVRGRYR